MKEKENTALWRNHGNVLPRVIPVADELLAKGEDVVYGDGKGNVYRESPNGEVRLIRREEQNAILT